MQQVLSLNKRKKNSLVNKLRKLEDRQEKLKSRIPYLEQKIDDKNKQKIATLQYNQKSKLLPLEQNAMGKGYYNYLKEVEYQAVQNELAAQLKAAQDELDEKLNEITYFENQKTRLDEIFNQIEHAKQGLAATRVSNLGPNVLFDEEKAEVYEVVVFSQIEKLRDNFQIELSKTETALEQLARENRQDSSLYDKYQNEVSEMTHGIEVLNRLLGVCLSDEDVPAYHASQEIVGHLTRPLQLFEQLQNEIKASQAQAQEKLKRVTQKETLNELNVNEVRRLFDEADKKRDAITNKYSDDNYPQWQKGQDSTKGGGSHTEIVARNIEVYEKRQLAADQELAALEEKLNTQKEQKLLKSKPKVEEKLKKISSQIEAVKKEIDLEVANTMQAIRNKSEKLTDEREIENFRKVLNMIDDENDKTQLLVENLTMQFGGLKAVNDLSFSVNRNEIYGLIGPNGAGKTTVFNCLTQFYKPTEGSLLFRNDEGQLINLTDYKVHEVIDHGIVRTFQNIELIWEISILDNMLVGAHSSYRTGFFEHLLHLPSLQAEEFQMRTRALEILEKLGLADYKDQKPVGLPYGILKRIELARTLMLNPKLIILDEPAAGLNEGETLELAEVIKDIRDSFDVTIFLVEHDMGLVMSICDRITAISFGKHLATGSPHEIQGNPLVQEAYLGSKDNE